MQKAFNFLESKKTPSNSFDLISKEISQYSVVNRGTFLLAFLALAPTIVWSPVASSIVYSAQFNQFLTIETDEDRSATTWNPENHVTLEVSRGSLVNSLWLFFPVFTQFTQWQTWTGPFPIQVEPKLILNFYTVRDLTVFSSFCRVYLLLFEICWQPSNIRHLFGCHSYQCLQVCDSKFDI